MPPILSIVGYSGSGKTTLIEKVIRELKSRGYRIGTIKHASRGFNLDKKGKDSWRHKEAGAETVMIVSSGRIAMVKDDNYGTLAHLEQYFQDMDLVITEGYKQENLPKIAVYRNTNAGSIPTVTGKDIIALVTDADVEVNIPKMGLDEIKALTDIIEKRFLSK
jgi:molybdopterin-guanine dinucleotide biosynthesis adapter protein